MCRKHFPYLFTSAHTRTHPSQQAARQIKQEKLWWEKEISYSYLASYPQLLCTHCHSPRSYKKSGVSSTGWLWPILFKLTEVPTEFYMALNTAGVLKGKQTGGLLLKKLTFYKHVISDNVHKKYKKTVWEGSKQTPIKIYL